MKPGETCNRWLVARLAALCRSTQGQFPNFQIHWAEQSFRGSDRSEPVARLADLPSLLEKSVLSPAAPRVESWRKRVGASPARRKIEECTHDQKSEKF